ncbi:hypothetical protein LEUCIP111803_01054 [Leucobacter soli]|uniref:Uncharacterized protein n=1 Tax=Leucobacter soli TaxID=2812850 RepID=A0A916JVR9_9MICO|nr:hypothetical protein LEUCIP111803_01054 [Leucobacter soli]
MARNKRAYKLTNIGASKQIRFQLARLPSCHSLTVLELIGDQSYARAVEECCSDCVHFLSRQRGSCSSPRVGHEIKFGKNGKLVFCDGRRPCLLPSQTQPFDPLPLTRFESTDVHNFRRTRTPDIGDVEAGMRRWSRLVDLCGPDERHQRDALVSARCRLRSHCLGAPPTAVGDAPASILDGYPATERRFIRAARIASTTPMIDVRTTSSTAPWNPRSEASATPCPRPRPNWWSAP